MAIIPGKSLEKSSKIRKEDKYIPAEWLKKLYETIDNVRDKAYITYHVETGLRVTDVIKSEWVHFDWQNNKTYTYDFKKDQWRWVVFPDIVKTEMKKWRRQMQIEGKTSKTLFNFTDKTANRILKGWLTKIEFPYAKQSSTHWLRHTFIRLSRRAGRDITLVKQNTGDTYKTILNWYEGMPTDEMVKEIKSKPLINL